MLQDILVEFYFGTGGLVRAYSDALIKAIEKSTVINKDLGIEVKMQVSYADLQKLQYYFNKNEIKILKTEFNENVDVIFEITKEKFEHILKDKKNLSFNILESEIIRSKYIEV